MDNLPSRRDEDVPAVREELDPDPMVVFRSTNFYERNLNDETPMVQGRRLKPHRACKICTVVPKLMERDVNSYTFEEATDVEADLYRFIYTFWSAEEIARWLRKTHEYDVAHDSVSRHISSHIPDPNIAMLDRVRAYRPDFMSKRFFMGLADTLKLSAMKYQANLATGAIPLSTSEFLQVARLLKEWQEFLGDLQKDDTDKLMSCVGAAMQKVLEPHPELQEQFMSALREELQKLEEEQEEQNG